MKKYLITLLVVCIPLVSFCQVSNNGLVGYWPFNGNANDESGKGNHGLPDGVQLTSDRYGTLNGAYEFDGIDDYIRIPHNAALNFGTGDFTICLWANFSDRHDYHRVITKYQSGNGWILYANSATVLANVSGNNNIDGGGYDVNVWNFYTIVRSSNQIRTYKNGIEVNSVNATANNVNVLSDLTIGNCEFCSGVYNQYMKGKIDDIMIYNRALTSQEIVALFNDDPENPLCGLIYCGNEGIGIGTPIIPDGYKLSVKGKVIAEGVKVAIQSKWPDYVFNEGYSLKDLSELKQYIAEYRHLPDVPSESDVKGNGIDLGSMDALLLQKIEEMTLHLIQLDERLKKLEAENIELRNR